MPASRPTCTACGREFQAAAAFPVDATSTIQAAGKSESREGYVAGCPNCFAWDDVRQVAVRVPGGQYGPHRPR